MAKIRTTKHHQKYIIKTENVKKNQKCVDWHSR